LNDITILNSIPELATLDKQQVAKITSRLPEYHRGKTLIGHSTSQTSYSLQTMNMISDSPLSRMKQCLAQIGKKYNALREAYFKVEEHKLEIKEIVKNKDEKSQLRVRELESLIESISISMENALREIGMFQNMYDSIKEKNNIPDNWSEKDFENQEIEHMIKSSFRIAIQDLSSTGRVSKAVVEYWEQLGIHPQVGEIRARNYLVLIQNKINNAEQVTITDMYEFLDAMVKEFGQEYKKALERIGLTELGSEEFMAKGVTKPQ
jgi:DNA-binding transcriptional regulator YiaG